MTVRRMTEPLPVRGIFETHLTVSDLDRSVAFYRDIVGLPLAMALPERGAAFFWVTEPGKAMIGLWSLGSAPLGLSLHVAFTASVADVLRRLRPPPLVGRRAPLVLRNRHDGAERHRLDAGRRCVLP